MSGLADASSAISSYPTVAYSISEDDVIEEVLRTSKEIVSLRHNLLSKEDLTDAERKYYIPTADLIAEYRNNYGQDSGEDSDDTELTLSITSTLYSSIIKDKIAVANSNRLVALYGLREKENELYFAVMEQLINVERSRRFLQESDNIKQQMNDYIVRITDAVDAGISPRSYLRETELVKVRFDDIVETVRSSIDNYFTQLSLITGYEVVNKDAIGINEAVIDAILADKIEFLPDVATKNNLRLLSRQHEVGSLKNSASLQFEKIKLSAYNDTIVGARRVDQTSSGNVRNQSAVGLRLEYKLYDRQRAKNKSASFNVYLSERELLNNELQNMLIQINELNESYTTSMSKRENLLQQIDLSLSLIETQEREILVDKIDLIDMAKSLSELAQTYVTLLNNDIQIFSAIISYRSLINERFN